MSLEYPNIWAMVTKFGAAWKIRFILGLSQIKALDPAHIFLLMAEIYWIWKKVWETFTSYYNFTQNLKNFHTYRNTAEQLILLITTYPINLSLNALQRHTRHKQRTTAHMLSSPLKSGDPLVLIWLSPTSVIYNTRIRDYAD